MNAIYITSDCPNCSKAIEKLIELDSGLLIKKIGDEPDSHFSKLDIMAFCQMNNSETPVIQLDDKLVTFREWYNGE